MPKYAFILLTLLSSVPCFAGSKGYTAVLMNIRQLDFFETKTYIANRDGDFDATPQWKECWRHRGTGAEIPPFEMIIRKKLPDGMTKEIAAAIWNGDQAAMKQAQQIMKGAGRSYGFEINGMYILKSEKDTISMIALGVRAPLGDKNPSAKLTIPWSDADPKKSATDLDIALCKVSKPLDFHFGP